MTGGDNDGAMLGPFVQCCKYTPFELEAAVCLGPVNAKSLLLLVLRNMEAYQGLGL